MDDDAPGDLTAGWKADPRGEARRRYWDGTMWTSLVSDQGQHRAPQVRGVAIPLAGRLMTHHRERLVVDDARIALYVDAFLEPLVVARADVRGACVGGGASRIATSPRVLNLPNVMTASRDRGNLTVVFRTPQRWPRVAMSMRIGHPRSTRLPLDGYRVRVGDADSARTALVRLGVTVTESVQDLARG